MMEQLQTAERGAGLLLPLSVLDESIRNQSFFPTESPPQNQIQRIRITQKRVGGENAYTEPESADDLTRGEEPFPLFP